MDTADAEGLDQNGTVAEGHDGIKNGRVKAGSQLQQKDPIRHLDAEGLTDRGWQSILINVQPVEGDLANQGIIDAFKGVHTAGADLYSPAAQH